MKNITQIYVGKNGFAHPYCIDSVVSRSDGTRKYKSGTAVSDSPITLYTDPSPEGYSSNTFYTQGVTPMWVGTFQIAGPTSTGNRLTYVADGERVTANIHYNASAEFTVSMLSIG